MENDAYESLDYVDCANLTGALVGCIYVRIGRVE